MTLSRRSPPLDRSAASQRTLPVTTVAAQRLRWVRRVVLALLWTLPCAAIQAVLLLLPGRGKKWLARIYWDGICHVLGVEPRLIGQAVSNGQPILSTCNHTSWLDVPTLGGTLEACFVAKAEVGTWPVVRIIAWLGRTVFVSRRVTDTGRERDSMRARLLGGDNLILFPEGTSSDGARVLPFRSPFFAVVEGVSRDRRPLIQPVSIVYDRLDYLPARRSTRPVSSWYGDMDLGGHFWRLARHRHLRATILFHDPIDPAAYPSRKVIAQAVWNVIAAGNAALRQGREANGAATILSLDRTTSNTPTLAKP